MALTYHFHMVFLLLTIIASLTVAFRTQSAGARGYLMCGSKPAANVRVKLTDKDFGTKEIFFTGPDPDDDLETGYTDANGYFELFGNTMESTNIDPQIKIYHDCNKGLNPCSIKWVIEVPDKYIYSGTQPPKKFFNLGSVNLEVELEEQSYDCIH